MPAKFFFFLWCEVDGELGEERIIKRLRQQQGHSKDTVLPTFLRCVGLALLFWSMSLFLPLPPSPPHPARRKILVHFGLIRWLFLLLLLLFPLLSSSGWLEEERGKGEEPKELSKLRLHPPLQRRPLLNLGPSPRKKKRSFSSLGSGRKRRRQRGRVGGAWNLLLLPPF